MHSEYDFMSTCSRRLRRTATFLMGAAAVLAGACSMALIIALPLQPRSNAEMERASPVSPAKSPSAAASSQKLAQPTGDTAAKTTGNGETQNSAKPGAAGGFAERGAANPRTTDAPTPAGGPRGTTGAQPAAARAASMRDKPPTKTKNAMIETNEIDTPAEREDGSATTPARLEMTSPDSSANSAGRSARKKHAYKRKPQKTRFARPSEDLRHHPFVGQSAFASGAWPLLSFTTNPQSRVHPR